MPGLTRLQDLTFVSVSAWILVFGLCAKGVDWYATRHPPKAQLLPVEGIVREVRLGGDGRATRLEVASARGTHQYSSYYGRVWPGMEHIRVEDPVALLAERDRLNRNEWFEGRRFYIWELRHRGNTLIRYEDILALTAEKDAVIGRLIDIWLLLGGVLLLLALLRKKLLPS